MLLDEKQECYLCAMQPLVNNSLMLLAMSLGYSLVDHACFLSELSIHHPFLCRWQKLQNVREDFFDTGDEDGRAGGDRREGGQAQRQEGRQAKRDPVGARIDLLQGRKRLKL